MLISANYPAGFGPGMRHTFLIGHGVGITHTRFKSASLSSLFLAQNLYVVCKNPQILGMLQKLIHNYSGSIVCRAYVENTHVAKSCSECKETLKVTNTKANLK